LWLLLSFWQGLRHLWLLLCLLASLLDLLLCLLASLLDLLLHRLRDPLLQFPKNGLDGLRNMLFQCLSLWLLGGRWLLGSLLAL
jgi:hypothetical protein